MAQDRGAPEVFFDVCSYGHIYYHERQVETSAHRLGTEQNFNRVQL